MTIFRNTNERFGQAGTVEAENIDELLSEMDEQIVIWAKERTAQFNDAGHNGEDGPTFDEIYNQIRDDFRTGLAEVVPARA